MLKITHKIALLIMVPLIIELCFLGVVMLTLDDVENDRLAESRAVETLVYVNLILNDTWTASGSMMMYRATGGERFMIESHDLGKRLDSHSANLKALYKDKKGSPEVDAFLEIVKEIVNVFDITKSLKDDIYFDSGEASSVPSIGKLRSLIKKSNQAGLKIIEQQTLDRQSYHQKQTQSRAQLKNIVEAAAIANVILSAILAIVFSLTFARRLRVLMDNTMNIAIGKPLGATLTGSDELALLDSVIHSLSNELYITREKERAMIDNTALIICSLNESFRISELNPAIELATGYSITELLGTNLANLIHEDDRKLLYEQLERSKDSDSDIEFEARLRKQDGRYIFAEWNAKWAAGSKNIFCVIHDITQRKEAERLKQEVIAMVSHDLRAPLTSLGVILDMMMEGVVGELNERGNRMVVMAKHSVSSLISMINDLIDVERYESGGLVLNSEIVSTHDLIDSAINMIKPEADRKSIVLQTRFKKSEVSLDAERINRVLVNLLSNAIKFSPEKSTVLTICQEFEVEPDVIYLEFKIIDEGPGIPPSKLEVVFEKFKQVGSGSEGEKRGSGLGLAICKAIVESHGGQIGAESEEGVGSTFWFRIPKKTDQKPDRDN